MLRLMSCLLLLAASACAAAQDHPEIARFPGFHIDASTRNDYNEFVFATRGYNGSGDPVGETKAGRFTEVRYVLDEGARPPSVAELVKNYELAFRKVNGALVRKDLSEDGPQGAVYRIRAADGGERWVQVQYLSMGSGYVLDVIDVAPLEQKVEVSADAMAAAIKQSGSVALHGILFDTGKAVVKPESNAQLTEVAALLKNDPALRLQVEGHTDNVGNAKANLELSRQRAHAVVAALVAQGVPAARLKAAGKGDTVPVADNRTDSGRAQNRRVELVKF